MPPVNHNWERINSEEGKNLKIFKTRFDYLRNPRNNQIIKVTILDAADAANVLAITPDQKILFVKQYRFGTEEITLELPGGLIEPNEELEAAGKRELLEETGYQGNTCAYLGKIGSNPAYMNNWIYHFVITDAQQVAEQNLDEGEAIETVLLPITKVYQMLLKGAFTHPHTISALALYFLRKEAPGI